jgi:hypothetical protein
MRVLRRALLALGISFAAVAPATPAQADHDIDTPFTGSRPIQLDLHGGLAWYGFGFAGGARLGIPLVHNGFIPSLDNAVYLNFGVDTYFIDWSGCRIRGGFDCTRQYGFGLGFPIALHWEFYFNDQWSAFAELGLQIFVPPSVFYGDYWEPADQAGAWVIAAAGGSYHFSDAVGITLRVGNPYVAFGVTFYL